MFGEKNPRNAFYLRNLKKKKKKKIYSINASYIISACVFTRPSGGGGGVAYVKNARARRK